MLEAPLAKLMFAPATNDTLEDVPLREKFVAAGTVGPTRVSDDAPEFMVMFAPATMETLLEVPLRLKSVAAGIVGPSIVMVELLLLNVMFTPATKDTLVALPFRLKLVAPSTDAVIVDAFSPKLTPLASSNVRLDRVLVTPPATTSMLAAGPGGPAGPPMG